MILMKTNHIFSAPAVSCLLLTGAVSYVVAQERELPVSEEQQKAFTPDEVLADLMEGNKRFVTGDLTEPNVTARIAATAKGQYPKAVVLSCLDSRVPVEQVFDQGIGDIFVGRVAGNIENEDQLGSMEFGTKLAGAKLVMVLGHQACGAVKGAIAGVGTANLKDLLSKIEPAVEAVEDVDGERTADNEKFVEAVVKKNVELTVDDIRERSEMLAEMEKAGEIKIVGAVYSLETGRVTLLD